MRRKDCDRLGLTDDQEAGLTGFTSRMVGALAHLREAWCVADASNRVAVEHAIRGLLSGHSAADNPAVVRAVLGCGLDSPERLWAAVGLQGEAEP